MLMPSIFAENLFDEFFDDFPMPREFRNIDRRLYGKNAAREMKTDVHEHEDHYEVDIDLPGFKKDEITLTLENGEKLTLTATLETEDNTYVQDYATIVGDIHESGAAAHLYAEYDSTADPFAVTKIEVNGVVVWEK